MKARRSGGTRPWSQCDGSGVRAFTLSVRPPLDGGETSKGGLSNVGNVFAFPLCGGVESIEGYGRGG